MNLLQGGAVQRPEHPAKGGFRGRKGGHARRSKKAASLRKPDVVILRRHFLKQRRKEGRQVLRRAHEFGNLTDIRLFPPAYRIRGSFRAHQLAAINAVVLHRKPERAVSPKDGPFPARTEKKPKKPTISARRAAYDSLIRCGRDGPMRASAPTWYGGESKDRPIRTWHGPDRCAGRRGC